MTLEEIKLEYEQACQMSTRPGVFYTCPKDGTILDEEKSVRWNREAVQDLRLRYAEEQKRLIEARNKAISEATDKAIKWIAKEGDFTEQQAKLIWDFVFDKYHPDGSMFDRLDEYMDFADGILWFRFSDDKEKKEGVV